MYYNAVISLQNVVGMAIIILYTYIALIADVYYL